MIELSSDEQKLWQKLHDLWEKSENKADNVKKNFDYWDGKYEAPANSLFKEQTRTACNVCKEIIEAKLTLMLDAQFSVAVMPETGAFFDLQTLKDHAGYADILNEELQNVFKRNKFEDKKEKIARWGQVAGFCPVQTTFDTKDAVEGEIKLDVLEPKDLRWDKSSKSIDNLNYIAYSIELNPMEAKNRYGRNPDGTFNDDICKRIDELADVRTDTTKGEQKGVVAIQRTETASLAYAYESEGI